MSRVETPKEAAKSKPDQCLADDMQMAASASSSSDEFAVSRARPRVTAAMHPAIQRFLQVRGWSSRW